MANPTAEQILQTCVLLNTPTIPQIQTVSDDIVNQGRLSCVNCYLSGGLNALPPTGLISFKTFPFLGRAVMQLSENRGSTRPVLQILVGTNLDIDDGSVKFDNLVIIGSAGYPQVSTSIYGTTTAQIKINQSFRCNIEHFNITQGSSRLINRNKISFIYPFVPGEPNEIKFQNDLFKNGMVFVKNLDGTRDLPVTMALTNIGSAAPLLTITGIPNIGGFCSAMLIVI